MNSPKRDLIDRDLGAERAAKQDLLNVLVRAQSLAIAGQLHTAMAVVETEFKKIRGKLHSVNK